MTMNSKHTASGIALFPSTAGKYVGLDDFVEITKNFAQGITPASVPESSAEADGKVGGGVLPLHKEVKLRFLGDGMF